MDPGTRPTAVRTRHRDAGTDRSRKERPAYGSALIAQPRPGGQAVAEVHGRGRIPLQPVPRRGKQAVEALVPATGAQILDVPALRRALLRDAPHIRGVQCGEHETAGGTLQGSPFLQIRGGIHRSRDIIRVSFHTIAQVEHRGKHRSGIPAHGI